MKERIKSRKNQMKPTKKISKGPYVMTPEIMISELKLTPARVADIEKRMRIKLHWFPAAYAEMQRQEKRKKEKPARASALDHVVAFSQTEHGRKKARAIISIHKNPPDKPTGRIACP